MCKNKTVRFIFILFSIFSSPYPSFFASKHYAFRINLYLLFHTEFKYNNKKKVNKKSSKPDLDKEIIGPTTRTIRIEHVLGDQILIQKLTVPRQRPFTNVFQFKCTLLGTKPPVWRRLQVPERYTFYDLRKESNSKTQGNAS